MAGFYTLLIDELEKSHYPQSKYGKNSFFIFKDYKFEQMYGGNLRGILDIKLNSVSVKITHQIVASIPTQGLNIKKFNELFWDGKLSAYVKHSSTINHQTELDDGNRNHYLLFFISIQEITTDIKEHLELGNDVSKGIRDIAKTIADYSDAFGQEFQIPLAEYKKELYSK